jgi:trigger factor
VKSAVETVSPTRAKLTVEVQFEELKPSLDQAYKKIAAQVNVPGFRRGKVPPMIIDRQIGRSYVLDEAVNNAIPKFYVEALEENQLDPLRQPEIEVTKFEDNEVLEFVAEVDVRPELTLPQFDSLEAEVEVLEVSDEDVEAQVEALRERFGSLSPVERVANDGDFVTIDLRATQNDEVVEGAEVAGMSYQVGRGGMLDGLDEALQGMAAGDSKIFDSELVGGDLVGEPVQVDVMVQSVSEQVLPEFDDDFAQLASEFDTAAELKADVRERLTRVKRIEQASAARDAVLEILIDQVEVPLPEDLVTEELNGRRANAEQQLAQAGMTLTAYLEAEGQTVEEYEADLERQVQRAVSAQFILDEVAKTEKIGVEQAELTQFMLRRAQQTGEEPQAFVNHMVEHNHIPELVGEIRRGKALAQIVENATVKDTAGSVVELATLQPDGTYADPTVELADA